MSRARWIRVASVVALIAIVAFALALATRAPDPEPALPPPGPVPVAGVNAPHLAEETPRGVPGTPPASPAPGTGAAPAAMPPDHPEPAPAPDEKGQVSIQWLGQSMFYLQSPGQVVVVTDPFDPEFTGYPDPSTRAHVVTVSHEHRDHNAVGRVQPFTAMGEKEVRVVRDGTYRRGDVTVTAIRTAHDARGGKDRGPNRIFLIEAGPLRIAHLGDLGHPLTPQQVKALGRVDIALVPVGGHFTLGPKEAAAVVRQLQPRLVIPMHYRTAATDPAIGKRLRPVEDFTVQFSDVSFMDDYIALVAPNVLPEKTAVWVLKYREQQ